MKAYLPLRKRGARGWDGSLLSVRAEGFNIGYQVRRVRLPEKTIQNVALPVTPLPQVYLTVLVEYVFEIRDSILGFVV